MFREFKNYFEIVLFAIWILFSLRRVSKDSGIVFPELEDTAMIRELHVYGNVIPLNEKVRRGE